MQCIVRKKESGRSDIDNNIAAAVKENGSKRYTIQVMVGTVMGYIVFSLVFLILVYSFIYPGKYQ